MKNKRCPECGLVVSSNTKTCTCGYSFSKTRIKKLPETELIKLKKKYKFWRTIVIIILLWSGIFDFIICEGDILIIIEGVIILGLGGFYWMYDSYKTSKIFASLIIGLIVIKIIIYCLYYSMYYLSSTPIGMIFGLWAGIKLYVVSQKLYSI